MRAAVKRQWIAAGVKALLAVASGVAVAMVSPGPSVRFDWVSTSPSPSFETDWTANLPDYALCGLLFAAGVLFPWLRRDWWLPLRAAGLVLVSALSLYGAIQLAVALTGHVSVFAIALGSSVLGAAVVLVGAALILPLRQPSQLAVTGLLAALLGGLAWWEWGFFQIPIFAPPLLLPGDTLGAFVAWHFLMACALHLSQLAPWHARDRLASLRRWLSPRQRLAHP